MPSTIIVSNRLPVSVRKNRGKLEFHPSVGGLATGLSDVIKSGDALWIGWPGIATEDLTDKEITIICRELAKHHCQPVFLNKREIEHYLSGYSNSVLWPFLHTMPADLSNQEKQWRAYKKVHQKFAAAVLAHADEASTIWVHDYQLLLLPELLRSERLASGGALTWQIGFFLHIPFPTPDHLQTLAHHTSLLKGLLGADLVGFHTTGYAVQFMEAVGAAGLGIPARQAVILPDRAVYVTEFPMGIDYQKFADARSLPDVKKEVKALQKQYGNYKTILTVDRLDPTKGFKERLLAYRAFLQANPHLHQKVIMVMVAVPSRGEIEAYRRLKNQVERLVKTINKQYGSGDWQPIDYLYTSVPFARLSALYQIADVAFVAPLRDGMNLVAKEYIASKPGKNGVLILSETAGAASELGEALLVNPTQLQSLTLALNRAVTMPPKELKKRLQKMQHKLQNNTVQVWAGSFMKSLEKAGSQTLIPTLPLRPSTRQKLAADFARANKRLLIFDYDGVLSPFVVNPMDAKPTERVLKLLKALGNDPHTDVAIVSGRSRQNLQAWFGKLPLTLAAEHCAEIRPAGGSWQTVVEHSSGWKKLVRPALERHAASTPGAFVEEKNYALVWHYRNASPYDAQKSIVVLRQALKPMLPKLGLKLYSGNKILEIKPPEATKAAASLLLNDGSYDFVMAIGDDYTDEDMFAALPNTAATIKVGPGLTVARWRLASPNMVHDFIKLLTAKL